MSTRREKIEGMLAAEPEDVFLRYQLAMEFRKEGDVDSSLKWFRSLIAGSPAHIPSYLMAAQMLADEEREEEARELLRDGIEEARRQGNSHAAGEMGDLLASL